MSARTRLLLIAVILAGLAFFYLVGGEPTGAVFLALAFGVLVASRLVGGPVAPPQERENPIPESGLEEVRTLAASGQTIAAIKRYRDLTGTGLAEAKRHVEALRRDEPLEQEAQGLPLSEALDEDIRTIATFGSKIEAIKRVRELSGVGLKEAKEYVESLSRR